ncbi:MAG: hypothetical protein ACRDGU_02105 [Actinomycetota bacterium]
MWTPLARWAGLALGVVDRPGDDLKIHGSPVPLLGGVAVIASTMGTLAVFGRPLPVAETIAVAAALAVGLADDVRPRPPWFRAGVLAAAGVVLAVGGVRLVPFGALGAIGTVLLTMACANAVNIMDGQDGLAGGVAAVAAVGMAVISSLAGDPVGVALGAALAGGLAGFLIWNRPPARIFLGNGGAYAVGATLAILFARISADGWSGALAAGTCLGVFVIELTLTVARRWRSARPLGAGDRLHSYDVLALGGNRGAVTLFFWGLGALAAAGGVLVSRLPVSIAAPAVGAMALGGLVYGAWLSQAPRRTSGV